MTEHERKDFQRFFERGDLVRLRAEVTA